MAFQFQKRYVVTAKRRRGCGPRTQSQSEKRRRMPSRSLARGAQIIDAAPSRMVRSDLFAFRVSKPVQSLRFSGSLVRRIK
jgi:hypothetical protein